VLRAEIDNLRGVDCGEIVRQLMDRDLVRMIGRASDLGRPYLYGTTKRFLRVFGLRSLDDLPRAAELRGRASDSKKVPTA
jgi:segregation and condensation protein B